MFSIHFSRSQEIQMLFKKFHYMSIHFSAFSNISTADFSLATIQGARRNHPELHRLSEIVVTSSSGATWIFVVMFKSYLSTLIGFYIMSTHLWGVYLERSTWTSMNSQTIINLNIQFNGSMLIGLRSEVPPKWALMTLRNDSKQPMQLNYCIN